MKTEPPSKANVYANTSNGESQGWDEMRIREEEGSGWHLDHLLREGRIGGRDRTGCLLHIFTNNNKSF